MTERRDATEAAALGIAERWLIQQGWKFVPADVGKRAKEILTSLDAKEPQS